jgi:hypothetical protein
MHLQYACQTMTQEDLIGLSQLAFEGDEATTVQSTRADRDFADRNGSLEEEPGRSCLPLSQLLYVSL